MEEFGELCRTLGCRTLLGTAGAPLRSSRGLLVVIITSYSACGPLRQPVPGRRLVRGRDSASSGLPSGWQGVPRMLHHRRWRAGQPSCTSHCLRLSLVCLSVSTTRSLLLFLVLSTFCNQFVDEAVDNTRWEGYPLWNRASCGALTLNVRYLSSL